MKLKYYNSTLGIGFNNLNKVYCSKSERWIRAKVHLGRLVYGNSRIPYLRIKAGIDRTNFQIKEDCPF